MSIPEESLLDLLVQLKVKLPTYKYVKKEFEYIHAENQPCGSTKHP
jgi:hypothetical protein